MPLSLLPPINLSSARELVKFEVVCTGRLAQPRPTLFSHDSSTSSHSASTEASTSSSSRRNRPSLSPEALLVHAFGPQALKRLPAPTASGSTTSSGGQTSSGSPPSSVTSALSLSRATSRSSKGKRKERHDVHPPPPPRGTFRSVSKSAKSITHSEGKLPLTELMPFGHCSSEPQEESMRHNPSCECERKPEREPPMSPEIWREKVEERRERIFK